MIGRGRAPACAAGALVFALTLPWVARAEPPPPPSSTAPSGVAVLARPGAESAAWVLAQEVYARSSLRPVGLDERRARVLVGGPAGNDADPTVLELGDERAGVHGEDGASRALLRAIASQLGVRAVVVVETSGVGEPIARVFLADTGTFDAARYVPDPAAPSAGLGADAGATSAPRAPEAASDGGMDAAPAPAVPAPPLHWAGAVASFERSYTAPPPPVLAPEPSHAPALATSAIPPEKPKSSESHPFYTSPWFWGAVGAAAFGGTAVYFATRDNSTGTIHLQLQQVPK